MRFCKRSASGELCWHLRSITARQKVFNRLTLAHYQRRNSRRAVAGAPRPSAACTPPTRSRRLGRGPATIATDTSKLASGLQIAPIGKLVHGGGYILALGTTHDTSTAYHVAEMSVPCGCIESFAIPDCIVREDGTVEEVLGLAFRNGPCPVPNPQARLNTRPEEVAAAGQGRAGRMRISEGY